MSLTLFTLIAYLVVLTPLMLLGYYFARRKMFNPHHKITMTLVLIANWVLIFLVMSPSFRGLMSSEPAPDFGQLKNILPLIHVTIGGLAQILGTYLVLLMWTEKTPIEKLVFFRIKNIKPVMRLTLVLWLLTIVIGVGMYAIPWHGTDSTGGENPDSTVTEEAPNPDATEEAPDPDATEEN